MRALWDGIPSRRGVSLRRLAKKSRPFHGICLNPRLSPLWSLMDTKLPAETTRRWIESWIVGLNLCPFAKRVFDEDTIRYVVSSADTPEALLEELARELQTLVGARREAVETSFLIHPQTLADFLDFNDFLGVAENLVLDLGLSGTVQLVGFHPQFQFADTPGDAPENYTNRSPFPMIHLLREVSVTEVSGKPEELAQIPIRNTKVLAALGTKAIEARLKDLL